MKTSIKLIIGAIVLPSVVVGAYLGYAYLLEKPKNIKAIQDLIKKRFTQANQADKYIFAEWDNVLRSSHPTDLRRTKEALTILLAMPKNYDDINKVTMAKFESLIKKIKTPMVKSGFMALSDKYKGLPFGT